MRAHKTLVAIVLSVCGARATDPSDLVANLPDFGAPHTKHYAGFSSATSDGKNKLFYYFAEADVGSRSTKTPLLIWLNGGPGASSMIGFLAENLGPFVITANGSVVENPHRITKKYHLMAVDNPVGAGFATTETAAYVQSEEEMRTQFVHALRGFYEAHPEYKENPLWITGESYAGKYVPHIAIELAKNATEIPFQGIVVGNGLYNAAIQYPTVGPMAFGAGVIDERLLQEVTSHEQLCQKAIAAREVTAGNYCENMTVRWLFEGPEAAAGQLFYYDFGLEDAHSLDMITAHIGTYLNRPDVKEALHVGNATWISADETGPVAKALLSDFVLSSIGEIVSLLEAGKEVFMYNGVRDGSVCNHLGNSKVLEPGSMSWSGASAFKYAPSKPWPSTEKVQGHIRGTENLRYATVLRTGHLVPMVVPDSFATMLDMAVSPRGDILTVV